MTARISGVNIVVAPGVTGQITVIARQVSWRAMLEAAAEVLGYEVAGDDDGIVRIAAPPDDRPAPTTVSLILRDVEVRRVVDVIAGRAEVEIEVAPGVKGPLTVGWTDVPWREALDSIAEVLGATVEEDGEALRLVPAAGTTK